MVTVNGFFILNINNVDRSSTFSPIFFLGVRQLGCPPFKGGTAQIHPKINTYKIDWFFFNSFDEQMHVSKIRVFARMFNCRFCVDRFVIIHWVEKNYIAGIPANITHVICCNDCQNQKNRVFLVEYPWWRKLLSLFISIPHVVRRKNFPHRFYWNKFCKCFRRWRETAGVKWYWRRKLITADRKNGWILLVFNDIFCYGGMFVMFCEIIFKIFDWLTKNGCVNNTAERVRQWFNWTWPPKFRFFPKNFRIVGRSGVIIYEWSRRNDLFVPGFSWCKLCP